MRPDIPQPPERDTRPQHWDLFLYHYGHTVYVAQLLEKHLASLLWYLNARKRNVVKRPTADELLEMIVEIDGNTFGNLLSQIAEYQLDHETMRLFKAANANRNILVHSFTNKYPKETADDQDFRAAATRVRELAAPILAAREIAEQLVDDQTAWMRAQIQAETTRKADGIASPSGEECEPPNENLGSNPYVIADKAKCLFQPEQGSAVRIIPPYGSNVDLVRDEGKWVLIRYCGKEAWSPRGNLSAHLTPRKPAVDVGVVPPPNYEFRAPERPLEPPPPEPLVEIGPRGGQYVRTASGFRRYL